MNKGAYQPTQTTFGLKPIVICLMGLLTAAPAVHALDVTLNGQAQVIDNARYDNSVKNRLGIFGQAGESVALSDKGQVVGQAFGTFPDMPILMLGSEAGGSNTLTVHDAVLRSAAAGYSYENNSSGNRLTVDGGVFGTSSAYHKPFPEWLRTNNWAMHLSGTTSLITLAGGVSHESADNNELTVNGGTYISGVNPHPDQPNDYLGTELEQTDKESRCQTGILGGLGGLTANGNRVNIDGTNMKFVLDDGVEITGGKIQIFSDRETVEAPQANDNVVTVTHLKLDKLERLMAAVSEMPRTTTAECKNNRLVVDETSSLKAKMDVTKIGAVYAYGQANAYENSVDVKGDVDIIWPSSQMLNITSWLGTVYLNDYWETHSTAHHNTGTFTGGITTRELAGVTIKFGLGEAYENTITVTPADGKDLTFLSTYGVHGGNNIHHNALTMTLGENSTLSGNEIYGVLTEAKKAPTMDIKNNTSTLNVKQGNLKRLNGFAGRTKTARQTATVTVDNNTLNADLGAVQLTGKDGVAFYGAQAKGTATAITNNTLALTQTGAEKPGGSYVFVNQTASDTMTATGNTLSLTGNQTRFSEVVGLNAQRLKDAAAPALTATDNTLSLTMNGRLMEALTFIDSDVNSAELTGNTLNADLSQGILKTFTGITTKADTASAENNRLHLKTGDSFSSFVRYTFVTQQAKNAINVLGNEMTLDADGTFGGNIMGIQSAPLDPADTPAVTVKGNTLALKGANKTLTTLTFADSTGGVVTVDGNHFGADMSNKALKSFKGAVSVGDTVTVNDNDLTLTVGTKGKKPYDYLFLDHKAAADLAVTVNRLSLAGTAAEYDSLVVMKNASDAALTAKGNTFALTGKDQTVKAMTLATNTGKSVTFENNTFDVDLSDGGAMGTMDGVVSNGDSLTVTGNTVNVKLGKAGAKPTALTYLKQSAGADTTVSGNTMTLDGQGVSYERVTVMESAAASAPAATRAAPTASIKDNTFTLSGKGQTINDLTLIDNSLANATVQNNTLTIAAFTDPVIGSLTGVTGDYTGSSNKLVINEQSGTLAMDALNGFDALDLTMNVDTTGQDAEHAAIYLNKASLTADKPMTLANLTIKGTNPIGKRLHIIAGDDFDPAKVESASRISTDNTLIKTEYLVERYWKDGTIQVGDDAKTTADASMHPDSGKNEFNAVVEHVDPSPGTDVIPGIQAGAMGLWNMDDLLVLDDVLAGSHTLATNNPSDSEKAKPFGIVSGGYAGLGNDHAVRVHGRSAAVGITATRPTRSGGTFKLSPFVQGGWSANTTDKGAEQHLDGHSKYAALGVAWRYMGEKWYQDSEVRLGWETENMNAYGFVVPVSTHAGAIASTVVLGVGYMPYQTETRNLDVYGRLQYSHVGERQVSAGDYDITLKRAISERLVLGTRYTQLLADSWQGMLGAGVEQEFKGTFNGSINGLAMTPFSTRGTTGFVETALTRTPRVEKGWHFGLRLRGYAGERDGVLGYLSATYRR